jgi:hypothetical protein
VRVRLPSPKTIVNFTANPFHTASGPAAAAEVAAGNASSNSSTLPTITSVADSAAYPPIDLPDAALLSVFVSFSDGSIRDFSQDNRASFAVTAGGALCSVAAAAGKSQSFSFLEEDKEMGCANEITSVHAYYRSAGYAYNKGVSGLVLT